MSRVADFGAPSASLRHSPSAQPLPNGPPTVETSAYLRSSAKRALDIGVSICILLVFVPLLIETALLIKATSRGPVLFRQPRYGAWKRPFHILKFRSMRVGGAAEAHFAQATRRDPRVTLIGRFIRKCSIDELPQLINVIKGDMSLVGPRPHPLPLDEAYASRIPHYSARFIARPGLTGWAQVNGARGETPTIDHMERRVNLDVHYVSKASLAMDLVVLAKSAREMVASDSAY